MKDNLRITCNCDKFCLYLWDMSDLTSANTICDWLTNCEAVLTLTLAAGRSWCGEGGPTPTPSVYMLRVGTPATRYPAGDPQNFCEDTDPTAHTPGTRGKVCAQFNISVSSCQ